MKKSIEEIMIDIRNFDTIQNIRIYFSSIENIQLGNNGYYNITDEYFYIKLLESNKISSINNSYNECYLLNQTGSSEFLYNNVVNFDLVVGNKFVDYLADVLFKRNIHDTFDEKDIEKFGNVIHQDAELLKKYNLTSTNISAYISMIEVTKLKILYSQVKDFIDYKF